MLLTIVGALLGALSVTTWMHKRGNRASRDSGCECPEIAAVASIEDARLSSARPLQDVSERCRYASAEATFRVLRDSVANVSRRSGGLPVEAQASSMEQFVVGLIEGIRAIDPTIIDALRSEFTRSLCRSTGNTDLDVLMFTKMASIDSRFASTEGLGCALAGRTQEDVVLWLLLDVWSATGREPLPVIARLAQNATDNRTKRRLLTFEEQRKLRLRTGESEK
jgi:hypothetical protein